MPMTNCNCMVVNSLNGFQLLSFKYENPNFHHLYCDLLEKYG